MCNYLNKMSEPTLASYLARTSVLLIFTYRQLGRSEPAWIYSELTKGARSNGIAVRTLANLLTDIGDEARLELFGRTDQPQTVNLAKWWHDHGRMEIEYRIALSTFLRGPLSDVKLPGQPARADLQNRRRGDLQPRQFPRPRTLSHFA